MPGLQHYWRKWRVKYRLQPIFEALLRPLHLKVSVRLGDDYGADMRYRKQFTTMQDYFDIYGEDAVRNKRFYSFGAGGWFHDAWTSVDYFVNAPDYGGTYIHWNVGAGEPFPVPDNSAEATHTSHMIDHLTDEEVEFLFSECYRILKPGGIFRVMCTDADLCYLMWRRKDPLFYKRFAPLSDTQGFLSYFTSQLVWGKDSKSPPRLTDAEVTAIFDQHGMEKGLDVLVGMVDKTKPRMDFQNHVSWWTNEKVAALMKKTGFSEVHYSRPGQSICPVMRDPRYFDTTLPSLVLCVDAVK
ncbi:MAG: class I SAM-dependent methyltransferase [Pseudomonadota bacterium]